jgi:hypothetical protein
MGVGYVPKLAPGMANCQEKKLFGVWLARSKVWFIFAKNALDAGNAAAHCLFHVLNSRSGVQIIIDMHIILDGGRRARRGNYRVRIVMIRAYFGELTIRWRWWSKTNFVDVLGELGNRFGAFGVRLRKCHSTTSHGFEARGA